MVYGLGFRHLGSRAYGLDVIPTWNLVGFRESQGLGFRV